MSSNNRQSDDQMKCVYMGPPMRRNLLASLKEKIAGNKSKKPYPGSFAEEKDPDDEPGLEEVYMGPPPEDEEEPEPLPEPVPKKAAEADRRLMEGVYAGPDIPPMAPVYAGPEMMNVPQRDPRVRGQEGPRMEALYAGPQRPMGQMMLVYAGPEYFAKRRSTQEDQTGTPSPDDKGRPSICPVCGSRVAQGRFCPKCGALLPETPMVKCPGCGSIVQKGRFCPECGMLFSQDENAAAEEESSHQL
ncbi:MAG: zinc ribbon domain-containing protein [Lachnospiraceae bacterium]|nr:zinc ribbon domain-containing protein [Lachnospiraceae bacterium]